MKRPAPSQDLVPVNRPDPIEEARELVVKVIRGLGDAAAGRTVASSDLLVELESIIAGAEGAMSAERSQQSHLGLDPSDGSRSA